MSWDSKPNTSRTYYYRSIREGSRVRKVYLGRGPNANEESKLANEKRDARTALHEASQQDSARYLAATQRLDELWDMTESMFQAFLVAAGFHRYKGQWRRRRCHGRNN